MKWIFSILYFYIICFNASGQLNEFSDYSRLYSVSIGISEYENIRSLNFAHNDAISFVEFVEKNEIWPKEKKTIPLTDENATAGRIYAALNECLSAIDSNDLVRWEFKLFRGFWEN